MATSKKKPVATAPAGVPGLTDRVPGRDAAPRKAKDKRQRAKGKSADRPPESEWTLNGAPIPAHLAGKIPFRLTDQGFAEYNAGKSEGRAAVTSDPLDKIHEQRERATQPW